MSLPTYAWIIVCHINGKLTKEKFAITSETTTIGRSEKCDITVKNGSLGRQHATITFDREKCIFSLKHGPTNSDTHVNHDKLDLDGVHALFDGDRMYFGNCPFSFRVHPDYISDLDDAEAIAIVNTPAPPKMSSINGTPPPTVINRVLTPLSNMFRPVKLNKREPKRLGSTPMSSFRRAPRSAKPRTLMKPSPAITTPRASIPDAPMSIPRTARYTPVMINMTPQPQPRVTIESPRPTPQVVSQPTPKAPTPARTPIRTPARTPVRTPQIATPGTAASLTPALMNLKAVNLRQICGICDITGAGTKPQMAARILKAVVDRPDLAPAVAEKAGVRLPTPRIPTPAPKIPTPTPAPSVPTSSLMALKAVDLRNLCAACGVSYAGTKGQMAARIGAAVEADPSLITYLKDIIDINSPNPPPAPAPAVEEYSEEESESESEEEEEESLSMTRAEVEDLKWPALRKLAAEHGIRGKKADILAKLLPLCRD